MSAVGRSDVVTSQCLQLGYKVRGLPHIGDRRRQANSIRAEAVVGEYILHGLGDP